MAFAAALPEDIYGGGPQDSQVRYWLSCTITRESAELSLQSAVPGSFILRRSTSSPGNYAISVVEADRVTRNYQITDLGLGQVGIVTGQAFASLEDLRLYFYDKPFPDTFADHVALTIMHQTLVGVEMDFGTYEALTSNSGGGVVYGDGTQDSVYDAVA